MQQYDLIVIGGGAIGSFHAWHALAQGKKVLMLERSSKPVGATVRNFGQVIPSGQDLDQWHDYGRTSLGIYKQIQAKYDITVRENGSVYLASDADELQLLHEIKALFDDRDYPSELLSPERVRQKWPSVKPEYCIGALFFPQEVSVEPRSMVHRLRALMLGNPDFSYRNNSPVIGCEVKNGLCEISTTSGERYHAAKAAICSGAEFRLLFPELFLNSGMIVSKLQMLISRPLPEVQLPGNILTGLSIRRYESFRSCPSYSKLKQEAHYKELQDQGIHLLFKQALDGSIIIGDSHEYAPAPEAEELDYEVSDYMNALILGEGKRILNLPSWDIARVWNGFYAQHPDAAFLREWEDRIFITTGIGGKGMTTSAGLSKARIERIFG